MLSSSFRGHPDVEWPRKSEPFANKENKYASNTSVSEIFERNFRYKNKHFTCKYPDSVKVVGVSVQGSQKDFDGRFAWKHFIKMKDTKIIFLERKNLLRRYLSLLIAKDVGFLHTQFDQSMPKYRIKNRELAKDFKTISRRRKKIRKYLKNMDSISVAYEDLISNYDETILKIQKFIGVSVKKLSPRTRKQNLRTLQDSIENYSQLKKDFKNTKWHGFFN